LPDRRCARCRLPLFTHETGAYCPECQYQMRLIEAIIKYARELPERELNP